MKEDFKTHVACIEGFWGRCNCLYSWHNIIIMYGHWQWPVFVHNKGLWVSTIYSRFTFSLIINMVVCWLCVSCVSHTHAACRLNIINRVSPFTNIFIVTSTPKQWLHFLLQKNTKTIHRNQKRPFNIMISSSFYHHMDIQIFPHMLARFYSKIPPNDATMCNNGHCRLVHMQKHIFCHNRSYFLVWS